MRKIVLLLMSVTFVLFGVFQAHALVIGTAEPFSGSCFPFGINQNQADRYQQVYDSSSFSGPITIGEIAFFQTETLGGGYLNSGTYSFYLSTTSKEVNALDTINFDDNLGADNHFFTTSLLAGEWAPAELAFSGFSFLYDPTLGNLLLDIMITDVSGGRDLDVAFFDAMNGTAGGLFSRAQNFGAGFDNYGLVTEFRAPVPEPSTFFLLGSGLAGLAFVKRRKKQS